MPQAATVTRIDPHGAANMERAAAFRPGSYRESDNSIEVVWSTGAAGLRFDWYDGGYYIEELSMEPGHIRLDRLNAGAPLLDSHRTGSLSSVLGSVVPGTARVGGGKGTARVRLASTPDVADTVAKIIDGHIRNISVSYHVFEFERTERKGEHPHMLATDWEPTEISMVTVPFDAGAQVRSRSQNMPDPVREPDPAPEPHQRQLRPRRDELTVDHIRDVCGRTDDYSRAFERELIEDHEAEPLTMREFQARCSEELIRIRSRDPIDNRAPRQPERGSPGQLHERMADALYARMSGTAPSEQAREFMGASLIDMTRGIMESRGERVRWASPTAIVEQMSRGGAHTTSDFPAVLGSAAQRYLADLITAAPSPLRPLARQRLANDFRRMAILTMANNPALLVVKENGEIKHGSAAEWEEGYSLKTYGRIFSITRQAIINDDLGAFTRIFEGWSRAASNLEADILAAIVQGSGMVMSDGKTLFHADHGNLAGSGSAITIASLSAARQAMRGQKDLDKVTPLNIVPKYLVVGAAKETEAEQVLAALAATALADVNPFSGKLELIVDDRLPGNSWRLFADPARTPVVEEARLAGQEDVFVDTAVGFEVDGIKVKARLDIAAAAVDWRGAYLNPGQ